MTITAKGAAATVTVDGDWLVLDRKVYRGTERIPLAGITGVDYKAATSLLQGRMVLHVPAKEPIEIVFRKGANDEFLAVRDAIEAARANGLVPPAAAPDLAEQLTKLAALRDQGILSDEEFAAQKAKLLG